MTVKSDPTIPFLRALLLDILPIASIVIMILMTVIPDVMPIIARMGALWPLIGIAYWTLARPRNLRTPSVFLLGLLMDIVSFVPLGVHALVFVMMQIILKRQRRFLLGQGFWVLWTAYALFGLSVYIGLYVLLSPVQPSALSFTQGLIGVAFSWCCVPLVTWILSWLHSIMDLFDEPIV